MFNWILVNVLIFLGWIFLLGLGLMAALNSWWLLLVFEAVSITCLILSIQAAQNPRI